MTEVNITNIPGYFRLSSRGHAGYGAANRLPEGHDIVCAAISVLVQTAAQYLLDLEGRGQVKVTELTIQPGNVDIKVLPKAEADQQIKCLEDIIKSGFGLLGNAYGAYINLGWEKTKNDCGRV